MRYGAGLYVKGVFSGFKRGLRTQSEHTARLKLEGVFNKDDARFYIGNRDVYLYKAHRSNSHIRPSVVNRTTNHSLAQFFTPTIRKKKEVKKAEEKEKALKQQKANSADRPEIRKSKERQLTSIWSVDRLSRSHDDDALLDWIDESDDDESNPVTNSDFLEFIAQKASERKKE